MSPTETSPVPEKEEEEIKMNILWSFPNLRVIQFLNEGIESVFDRWSAHSLSVIHLTEK